MNKNDSTLDLLKSLKSVNFSFSKQDKDFAKFFSFSSVQNLIKKVNKKVKVAKKFELPKIKEQTKVNSNIVNINIKSSFNYVTELASLKNYQVTPLKKKKNYEEELEKMKLFKELFYVTKEKIVDLDFRKKRYEKIKDKYLELKSYGVKEVTLDPGKYFPKYDFVYKRNPVTFLGNKNTETKNIENNKKDNNSNKNNKYNIRLIKNKSAENLIVKNKKIKRIRNIKIKEKEKESNEKNRKTSENEYLYQTFNSNNKLRYMNDILQIQKINSFKLSKKLSAQPYFNKKTKGKLYKSSSAPNINKIRCPIVFNKMPGRDRKIVFKEELNEVNYTPNYDITRAHVPATIFRHTFDYSKFKKYVTGKIIRSYLYTPDNYFILEMKKSMENENKTNKSNKILNNNYNIKPILN